MKIKRTQRTVAWMAAILGLVAFGLLGLTLDGIVAPVVANFAWVAAIGSAVSWILLQVGNRNYLAHPTAQPIVPMSAPGWDLRIAGKETIAHIRPGSAHRVVSRPVPIPRGDSDTIRIHGGLKVAEAAAVAVRDDLYWQVYSDLTEDILSNFDEDQDR